MTRLTDSLAQTEDQIRDENQHIEHEKKIIEEVRRQHHDPSLMVKSLEAMKHYREALHHHRRILLERLGLYRP